MFLRTLWRDQPMTGAFAPWLTHQLRTRIGWAMWAIAMVTGVGSIVLAGLNGWPLGMDPWGVQLVGALGIGSLGMSVVSKRPENVIGWLMLWQALFEGLSVFGLQYGIHGMVVDPGSIPYADLIGTAPYGAAVGFVFGTTITFFLLLFPDGRLPSPRWRPVAWMAGAGVLLMAVALTWHAVSVGVVALLDQLNTDGLVMEGLPEILNAAGHVLVFAVFPLAVISLFIRRRRADAIVRQQLKWFAYGSVVFLSSVFIPLPEPYWLWYEGTATVFMYVAIAIAILRYGLFEIDRIVSRTVGYAVVLVLAGLVYVLGAVWLPSRLIGEQPPVFVAGATLLVAGLFNPVRKRVLEWVDRRFYRSRYDTDTVVDEFSNRLRDQVDVDRLTEDWVSVVATTLAPSSSTVWVREPQ